MENLKKIKKIIIWLGILFTANLILIVFMLSAYTLWTITAVIVQLVIGIYLIGISIALIKEIEEKENKNK